MNTGYCISLGNLAVLKTNIRVRPLWGCKFRKATPRTVFERPSFFNQLYQVNANARDIKTTKIITAVLFLKKCLKVKDKNITSPRLPTGKLRF